MSGRVDLLRLLHGVRRRLRVRAAVEGAVLGACLVLAGWAVWLALARIRGTALPGRGATGWALAVLAAAAAVSAVRRISLARCARALDRSLGGNDDRVFIASDLADRPDHLARAAVDDALRSAQGVVLGAAAPWRRPRGLAAAAGLIVLVVALGLWPARPASSVPRLAPRAKGPGIDARALALDRRAATEAARRAAELGDAELARLATELERLLTQLTDGALDRGVALDQLGRMRRETEQAAGEGRDAARELRAAAEAMSGPEPLAPLASALAALDDRQSAKALDQVANQVSGLDRGQRQRLAEALGRAADAAGQNETTRGQRRLDPPRAGESGAGTGAPQKNRLKRLERDLSDAAAACQQDPEACRKALQQAQRSVPPMAREGQRSASRDRLGRAMEQLRERLRRMDPGDQAGQEAELTYERSAGGGRPGEAGEPGQGADPGQAQGAGAPIARGTPEPGGEEGQGQAGAAAAQGSAGGGEGQGQEAGGEPLGARQGADGQARGETHSARLRSGAGPSRAEVIESGARRGFARTEYQRVFDEYSAAVEETLDTTAVPAPRRYLVRRYFELIRPRGTP